MNEKDDLLISCYDSGKSLLRQIGEGAAEQLAYDVSSDIRALTAKALVHDAGNPFAAQLLRGLAKDRDSLVRTEALDSLSAFHDRETIAALQAALEDPDHLARAYAALGFAESSAGNQPCANAALRILTGLYEREPDTRVRVSILEGLYVLGRENTLDGLFQSFDSDDYHVQCAVLNALRDILSPCNCQAILRFAQSLPLEQLPRSVSGTAARLLDRAKKLVCATSPQCPL